MKVNYKSKIKLNFVKMQGLGNDFVVFDTITQKFPEKSTDRKKIITFLAERNFGVGCDQVLIIEPAKNDKQDFFYQVYNSDGSIANQCGNGARCAGLYIHNRQLSKKKKIVLGIIGDEIVVEKVHSKSDKSSQNNSDNPDIYRVEMPAPNFITAQIPFRGKINLKTSLAKIILPDTAKTTVEITPVSMGNPHAVQVVADVLTADVENIGKLIESHSLFPKKVNVGFMEIINSQKIRLRVYERGCGETLACGSGACAAVVAGIRRGLLTAKQPIKVILLGGELIISWSGKDNERVIMQGAAVEVFSTTISI